MAPHFARAFVSRVGVKHLAGDPAGGVGGGEAGVTAGVVDDLGDLVLGQPVVAGDLDVEPQLVGGAPNTRRPCSRTSVMASRLAWRESSYSGWVVWPTRAGS